MYEVYICKLNDEILYVGQGYSGRHKHCTSGCSHVYELNKLHFSGLIPIVEVVHIDSRKDRVLELEKSLIKNLKPKYNVVYNENPKPFFDIRVFKKHIEQKDSKVYYSYLSQLHLGYEDFKHIYKSIDFRCGFKYDTARKYETRKLYGMRTLSSNYYGTNPTYSLYFAECVNDMFMENMNDNP